ncbi:MAG: sigma factor [Caldilineaceae bacterium]
MQSFEPLVTTARSPQYNREQRHAAFAQLVTQFHGMVFTYAHQIVGDEQLAQDAIQEAFLTAYQQLAQLREPAAFSRLAAPDRAHALSPVDPHKAVGERAARTGGNRTAC